MSKKCKGTGKAKGHGCGAELHYTERDGLKTYNAAYGLGRPCGCYAKWLLGTKEGKEAVKKATLKATAPRRGLEAAMAERKRKTKDSLPDMLHATELLVNKYIRLRDRYKPCISSNKPWDPSHEAGHCYPVGKFGALRFDFDNIHGQSIGSNRFKEGDVANYMLNLPGRIGKERAEALHKRAAESKRTSKKWTREELKNIQATAKAGIKKWAAIHGVKG